MSCFYRRSQIELMHNNMSYIQQNVYTFREAGILRIISIINAITSRALFMACWF